MHGWLIGVTRRQPPPVFFNLLHFRGASTGGIPKPPLFKFFASPSIEEISSARGWLEQFSRWSIPKDQVELDFARSSGPGGQNVNKVNTKATLRCSLDKPWIPIWAREQLRDNPAYVASSQSLLVTSTQSRSQAQNVEDCFKKLHSIIRDACSAVIPTPSDPERMARKTAHERVMRARNRTSKMHRSNIKSNRRGD